MDPFSFLIVIIPILVTLLVGTGWTIYDKRVTLPRAAENRRLMIEQMESERLAIEMKQEQDAALTLEDKIWLFDMGRTEWTPEKEIGFVPEFNVGNTCIHYLEFKNLGAASKIYLWDLPDWYVDFLTTRPFHSDLAKYFYDLSANGVDVKTHIAELKQERDERIAKIKALEEEKHRKHQEFLMEQEREYRAQQAKAKAIREEAERIRAEERKQRAIELEEKRRKNLGLTGTYLDVINDIYRSGSWDQVHQGRSVVYAPGSNAYTAVKELQKTFGLAVTGAVDEATFREMQIQSEVDNLVKVKSEIVRAGEKKPVYNLSKDQLARLVEEYGIA